MKYLGCVRITALSLIFGLLFSTTQVFAETSGSPQDIIKTGLIGAATGALSSGMSGGKAGKGALIGAGTNVIGSALLSFLTGSSSSNVQSYQPQRSYRRRQAQAQPLPVYRQTPVYTQQPVYVQQPVYTYNQQPAYSQQPVYVQPAVYDRSYQTYPSYSQPSNVYRQNAVNPNTQIIKNGLLGAAVGAISAEASGGKAGQGALVGAGSNVIGGALIDMLFSNDR